MQKCGLRMPASKKNELAKNLIKYRKQFGLTQDDVAKKIDKSRSAYAYYERTVTPPLNILKKLADVFNISIDELSKTEDKLYNVTTINKPDFALSQSPNLAYKIGSESDSAISFDQLSQEEKNLIFKYHSLPSESKKLIMQTIEDCLKNLER